MKTEMDIERLLQWAYLDELSKRQTSAAEGIWDRISETSRLGADTERGRGSGGQRYDFGLPHADAEAIEREVGMLERVVINWPESIEMIAGELQALVSINGTGAPGHAGRDALLVNSINVSALITQHAIQGGRPDWRDDPPVPYMVQAAKGPHAAVVGECKGRNLYTAGSHCPLRWEPSPLSIIMARADYVAWHDGLKTLCERLNLQDFKPLPPAASYAPWIEPDKPDGQIIPFAPRRAMATIPLKPSRPSSSSPMPRSRHGVGKSILSA